MGGGGSKPDPGSQQQLLGQFSGTDPIDVSDPFWARLLQFPVPLTRLPPAEVEATTAFHCEQLGAALEGSTATSVRCFLCQSDPFSSHREKGRCAPLQRSFLSTPAVTLALHDA